MSKHSWQVAMVALTAGLGLTPSSAHSDDPNPIIAIEVDDRTGSFTARLPRAKSIASDIYRQAGVALQWSAGDETVVDRTLTVVITDSTSMSGRFAPGAMGVAPSPGDGTRGTLAYVFRDRVMAFADAHRLAHAYVLAAALAHEIGHLMGFVSGVDVVDFFTGAGGEYVELTNRTQDESAAIADLFVGADAVRQRRPHLDSRLRVLPPAFPCHSADVRSDTTPVVVSAVKPARDRPANQVT